MDEQDDLIERLIQSLNDQPGAADLLVAVLSDRIRASQRSGNLQDASHEAQVRFLSGGTAVTADSTGVGRDVIGEAYFDTVNVVGGTATVNANNPRQVDITVGGGADCLFDYLVSGCFATQTSFLFTEGMSFTTASGCTFKGYSTIQGAITAMAALSASSNSVLAICGGTYSEQVSGTPSSASNWDILGAGSGSVSWAASGNNQTLFDLGTLASGSRVRIKGIHFNLGSTTGSKALLSANGVGGGVSECHFSTGGSTSVGIALSNTLILSVQNCSFTGSGTGYKPTLAQMADISGCTFNCGVGIDITGNRVNVSNSTFNCSTMDAILRTNTFEIALAGGNEFNTGIQFTSGTHDSFTCGGNTFRIATGAVGIDFSGMTVNSNGFMVGLNSFKGSGTAIGIKLDAQMITGMIGPNAFKGFSSGSEISGSGGGVTAAHNVSDAGAIADIGSPVGHVGTGTGGAAPNNAQYLTLATDATLTSERVWTPGNGLINGATDGGAGSTYTVALKDLNANWTQAGVFDISTAGNLTVLKHLAVGASAAIDANVIMAFTETFGASGSNVDRFAIGGTVTRALSAADSGTATGIEAIAVISGAFADTGVNTGVRAKLQRTNASTSATMRGFDSQFIAGAGSTTTDRFAYYASNATSSGTLTNQYGFYVPTFTKGGTLNWAFYSVSAPSFFGGANTLGPVSAPSTPAATNLVEYNETGTQFLKVKDASGNVYNETHLAEIAGVVDGTVTTQFIPVRIPSACTFTAVKCKTQDKKTTSTWRGDVYLVTAANENTDGGTTTILSAPFGPSGGGMAATGTLSTTTAAAGDWLVFASTTSDATVTGVTMVVEARYT